MKRVVVIGAALVALAMAPAGAAQDRPSAVAVDWSAAARQDAHAAYDIYIANHPGMHDPLNPGFADQLMRARDAALASADRAVDEAGYREALAAFSAELQDGHAKLAGKQPEGGAPPLVFQWPGFVAAWRGDGLMVHHAAPDFPVPAGSAILGCDGIDVRSLIKRNMAIHNFRAGEAGQWWSWAPHVFVPSTSLASRRPQSCDFREPNGTQRTLTLDWSPAPDTIGKLLNAATDGEHTPIGLTEPRPGIFLIGLPDFQPGEEGIKTYRQLFETLKARKSDFAEARAVVIDLRHNNGGSSSWGRNTARALWGEATVDAEMTNLFKDVRIWWRASPDNTAYVHEIEPILRERGATEAADLFKNVAAQMTAALAEKRPFYIDGEEKKAERVPVPPSGFDTPVYVITPGRCGSACLDAVDTFKRFSNVTLIGAPTSADSTYMEIRTADLPSGKGRIVIPNKVWMGRPRKSGEFYTPDILVADLDWSTATFLDRVEGDLTAR